RRHPAADARLQRLHLHVELAQAPDLLGIGRLERLQLLHHPRHFLAFGLALLLHAVSHHLLGGRLGRGLGRDRDGRRGQRGAERQRQPLRAGGHAVAHQMPPPMPRAVTSAWATFWLSIAVAGSDCRTRSRCSWLLTAWPSLVRRMLWPMLPARIHCSAAPCPATCSSTRAPLPSKWTLAEAAPEAASSEPDAAPAPAAIAGASPSRRLSEVRLRAALPSPATCTPCTRPDTLPRPAWLTVR